MRDRGLANSLARTRPVLSPEQLTRHLMTMAELNRAGRYDRMADGVERVAGRPAIYRWSSAAAKVCGRADTLVRAAPLRGMATNWRTFLARVIRAEDIKPSACARAHRPTPGR
jgi:hypothetical protein